MYNSIVLYGDDSLNKFLSECNKFNHEIISCVGSVSGMESCYTIIYKERKRAQKKKGE